MARHSQEVCGDGSRWRELFETNREQIKDPKLIRPGQELRIS
jgi:nucleoid-associated protein YgaU